MRRFWDVRGKYGLQDVAEADPHKTEEMLVKINKDRGWYAREQQAGEAAGVGFEQQESETVYKGDAQKNGLCHYRQSAMYDVPGCGDSG